MPNKPISSEDFSKLHGKSVALIRYEIPNFIAATDSKAKFAGSVEMIAAGNEIVKKNKISDPAIAISDALIKKLAKNYSMQVVSNNEAIENKENLQILISKYNGVDYLIDVKTIGWLFGYYPNNRSYYRVLYSARLRFIDVNNKSISTEKQCISIQGNDTNPPSKEQLLENNAELLKSYLSKAANKCVDEFF